MNNKYFFCYNGKLKNFLSSLGFSYITHAQNIIDGKKFWLFEQSTELKEAIDSYKKIKNTHY